MQVSKIILLVFHNKVIPLQMAGSTPTNASNFELYDGPIIGSDAVCNGSESRIVDCIFDRNNNCDHINDLAVRCLATASGSTNLYTCT